jgi:hypothetical protein
MIEGLHLNDLLMSGVPFMTSQVSTADCPILLQLCRGLSRPRVSSWYTMAGSIAKSYTDWVTSRS